MAPLQLKPERSRLLERIDAGLHLLAVVCVLGSGIGWAARLGLVVTIIAYYLLRRPDGQRQRLLYSEPVGWALEGEGEAERPLQILPGTVVSPWFVLLQVHDGRKHRFWTIARDSLDAESFRRLRVYLRVLRSAAGQVSEAPASNEGAPFQ